MAASGAQTLQLRRPGDNASPRASWGFAMRGDSAQPLAGAPPMPLGAVWEIPFGGEDLTELRELVASWACREAMPFERVQDLVLAVHEIAANSVRHGGGVGMMRLWREGETLLCDVQDSGHMSEPLIGLNKPGTCPSSGRGMWIANELCDLVEVCGSERGNQVRLHKRVN